MVIFICRITNDLVTKLPGSLPCAQVWGFCRDRTGTRHHLSPPRPHTPTGLRGRPPALTGFLGVFGLLSEERAVGAYPPRLRRPAPCPRLGVVTPAPLPTSPLGLGHQHALLTCAQLRSRGGAVGRAVGRGQCRGGAVGAGP